MSENHQNIVIKRRACAEAGALEPGGMHPVLQRVLAARGVTAATADLSLGAMLPVSELDGIEAAVERLAAARNSQERVLVLGDFDVDGATATALMISCLRGFGFTHADYLVPDRQRFGYGLSPGIVEQAAERKPGLIVTVDNGISSHAGVAAAASLGIDVLITDHHLPGDTLPAATAIVNPNAPGNGFPSGALSGVGVAFYVMAALGQRLAADGCLDAGEARRLVADCLDLVALGTVADLVPLDYNNRILVSQGMARIRAGQTREGMRALFAAAGKNMADAATSDLGFAIAPRLNAAGRLTDMTVGINCLLEPDATVARRLAEELSRLNMERRQLQADMQADAELHIDELEAGLGSELNGGACLFDPGWHQGIVGLVATRIKDRVRRPVVAFAPGDNGLLKGSGRSVPGVHLRDLLAAIDAHHPGLIDRFGGHAMAAGLSLDESRLAEFRAAFNAEVAAHADQMEDMDQLWSDGELDGAELSLPVAELLRHAAPWGQAFPEPQFDGLFEVVEQRIVGERHLKLRVRPAEGGQSLDAIAFNQGDAEFADGTIIRLVYRLDVNEFRGRRRQQLVVEHMVYD